jgi:hypothetical protein
MRRLVKPSHIKVEGYLDQESKDDSYDIVFQSQVIRFIPEHSFLKMHFNIIL